MEPAICPVLAMAKYMLSNPDILLTGALFPGSCQYDRFIKAFHRVIDDNLAEFRALGVEPKELGSHSCRKGAITLVMTGCTISPPTASVCLRAGWSFGSVKDRYIFYEKAGDQFTGRTVTGISSLSKEFAISPVYWDFSNVENLTAEAAIERHLTDYLVKESDVLPTTFGMLVNFRQRSC